MRIVSLLPSSTDLVCALGLREHLVGRTHDCDWPPGIESVPVMTRDLLRTQAMTSREIDRAIGARVHSGSSLYALDQDALAAAKPDLILTQELCEVCAVSYREVAAAARMMEVGPAVVSLEPRTLEEILDNVRFVGELTGTETRARALIDDANRRLERVRSAVAGIEPVRTACIEWIDPLYNAGHWVPDQVARAGGVEVLGARGEPSRPIDWQALAEAGPQAVLLMPCGFSMARAREESRKLITHEHWRELPAVRSGSVWMLDGPSYFNRPGPRVIRGVEIVAHALHGFGTVGSGEAVNLGSWSGSPEDRYDHAHPGQIRRRES